MITLKLVKLETGGKVLPLHWFWLKDRVSSISLKSQWIFYCNLLISIWDLSSLEYKLDAFRSLLSSFLHQKATQLKSSILWSISQHLFRFTTYNLATVLSFLAFWRAFRSHYHFQTKLYLWKFNKECIQHSKYRSFNRKGIPKLFKELYSIVFARKTEANHEKICCFQHQLPSLSDCS